MNYLTQNMVLRDLSPNEVNVAVPDRVVLNHSVVRNTSPLSFGDSSVMYRARVEFAGHVITRPETLEQAKRQMASRFSSLLFADIVNKIGNIEMAFAMGDTSRARVMLSNLKEEMI